MKRILPVLALSTLAMSPLGYAIELIGQVKSNHKQNVVAEVSGVIEHIELQPGDQVKKHQLLANIKTQSFDFELAKKQATFELAQAEMQLKRATFQRFQQLVDKQSLSQNELDIAKAEYLNAKASLALAKVELTQVQQNLSDTKINAAINGFVVTRQAEAGAWVNQGDLLYQLVNIDTLTVKLLASEHDIQSLHIGQPILVWPEANPALQIESTIKRIGVEVDADSLAYPIEIDVINRSYDLKPGMSIYASTKLNQP